MIGTLSKRGVPVLVGAAIASFAWAEQPARAQILNEAQDFMGRVFGPPEGSAKKSHEPRKRDETKPKAAKPAREKAEAGSQADARAPSPPPTVAAPVPVPDPRPAQDASDKAAAAKDTPAEAPMQGPAGDEAVPVPAGAETAQPVPAEAKPVEEIPVPEKRPPVEAVPAASPPADTAKPVEGRAGAEPSKPEDAPNSTEKLKSREPEIDPATAVVAAAAIRDAEDCEAELKKRGATFEVKPSISEGECGVLRPVAFGRSSSGVKVGPDTQMLCRTALALDIWLADVVAPAAKVDFPDRKLTEFRQASTYVCRPRASETGISEHSRGSAIDIGSFAFDKGEEVGVAAHAENSPEQRFMDAVRTGACGPFKTVLGPGTDADHATHFHLDIAARRNGSTYCK